jgi:hypothetical protein
VRENARLKRLVADQALNIQVLKEVNAKKASPSQRRHAVQDAVAAGVCSRRQACRYLGLARSGSGYRRHASTCSARRPAGMIRHPRPSRLGPLSTNSVLMRRIHPLCPILRPADRRHPSGRIQTKYGNEGTLA